MITVYCDESHDEHVYALAGWIAPPSAWNRFDPRWREMLSRHPMPDGSPMKAFHASDIVNRDVLPDSPFRGWTFEQEKAVFNDAVSILTDENVTANVWPIGCAVAIPAKADWVETRNTVWHLLYCRLLVEVPQHFAPQNGFSFVFDEKPDNAADALAFYNRAKELIDRFAPGKLAGSSIVFMSDEATAPLQAADLFVYEWRRRISEKIHKPEKQPRTSYRRLIEGNPTNRMLRCYGPSAVEAIKAKADAGGSFFAAMFDYGTTEE